MKKEIALLAGLMLTANSLLGAIYSTEATIAPQPDKKTCLVTVRLSEVIEKGGRVTEKLLFQPKITMGFGDPAHMYTGPSPGTPDYNKEDNITVDVSWPTAGERGMAFCTVTLRHGDKLVSKSKFQVAAGEPK